MASDFRFIDHSAEVLDELEGKAEAALNEIGLRAVGYAQMNAPVGTPESTGIEGYSGGSLRKSLTYKVHENAVYIGTNVKSSKGAPYPLYVELGTGIHAADGKGRKSPWIWTDKNGKKHWTRGIKPTHFLKKSVEEHREEFVRTIKRRMRGE